MACGNCGAPIPDSVMFCPECGTDVRSDGDGGDGRGGSSTAASGVDARGSGSAGDASAGDASAGDVSAGDEFDWGVGDDDPAGESVVESAGDRPARSTAEGPERSAEVAGTGTDADDDDDGDEPAFEEPTRLSRPPGSRHPEPLMGTSGEVVGHRVGAFLVDRFVLGVATVAPFVAGAAVDPVLGSGGATTVVLIGLFLAFVFGLVYTLVLEGVYGQTLGKRLFGIVVVMEDGSPCTMGASVLRSLLWVADRFYLGLVGFGLILTTDRNQRFGDMIADTVVVRTA